jgi:S-adenosylmethionine/arginine decarboxylase-like enzyme
LKTFLRKLTEEIRMTPLPEVCSYRFEHTNPKLSGVSVTQLLAESHVSIHPCPGDISVHTWPETQPKPSLTLVIYSCRKFRMDKAIRYAQRVLRPEVIDVREAERKYVLCRKGGEERK